MTKEAAQRSDVHEPPLSLPNAASLSMGERSFALAGSTSREVGNWDPNSNPQSTYCLVMDSGAAWHIKGVNVERCPNDGCDCDVAGLGGWITPDTMLDARS